jgi:hypothetical protein
VKSRQNAHAEALGSLSATLGARFQVKIGLQGVHANQAILFRRAKEYPFVIRYEKPDIGTPRFFAKAGLAGIHEQPTDNPSTLRRTVEVRRREISLETIPPFRCASILTA